MNYINTFFEGISHLIYPHLCAGCGDDVLERENTICANCIANLPFTNFHGHAGNPVEKVFIGRLSVSAATSFLYFTKGSTMQSMLHQLKYKGRKDVGSYLGSMLGEALHSSERFKGIDVIIPLPLHPAKKRRRGYNQAEVVADGISRTMNIPVTANIISNIRRTNTQTRMNRMARSENSLRKFHVADNKTITDKHVLLVDDVITTGATIEACGNVLLAIPGLKLSVASLAYTLL